MSEDPTIEIGRWLAAERLSRIDEAETSFRAVFRQLPYRGPRVGFAGRVLAAAGLPTRDGRALNARWLRVLGGAGLLLVGLAAAAPSVSMPMLPAPSAMSGLLALVVRGFSWAGRLFDVGLSAWSTVGAVGQGLRAAAATPQAVALLTANLALAIAALWGLSRLMDPQEERV
jgi:hypothetical protein